MAPPNRWRWAWAPGDGGGQGSLACSSLWGRRVGHDSTAKQQQLSCVSRGGVFRAASGPLRWWALRSGTGSCSVNTCRWESPSGRAREFCPVLGQGAVSWPCHGSQCLSKALLQRQVRVEDINTHFFPLKKSSHSSYWFMNSFFPSNSVFLCH